MNPATRNAQFREIFPDAPSYRWKQVEEALYSPASGWKDVTSLPAAMRAALEAGMPWSSVRDAAVVVSGKRDTHKAALLLSDGACVETVLMANRRGEWTICVSSQVGCAMRCTFCATGKMGLLRNLTEDEIADQYRFWAARLRGGDVTGRISNVVFMGMGEPLANYDNVKRAIRTLLARTDLGPTHVTVSTSGILPRLEELLEDAEWPHVRLAISLHSADERIRQSIMPSSYDGFLARLSDWSVRYLVKFGNRRHHLTYEYVMLGGVNDRAGDAEKLAAFANASGKVKVNLIPYNFTDAGFVTSAPEDVEAFAAILERRGVTVTVRRTMGDDIAAACGQLIVEKLKKPDGGK